MKNKLTKSIVFLCILTLTAFIGMSSLSKIDPGPVGQVSELTKNL